MIPTWRYRIIWFYALCLVVFYTPYAGLAKAITAGLVPGIPLGLVGLEILPAAILGTVVMIPVIITLLGWWKYADLRSLSPAVALSGLGLAMIIGSTTVAYTFKGISIVLALLLMRGGLLIMGPITDAAFGRRVRWFSWAALVVSFAALLVSLVAAKDHSLPLLAALNLAAYLLGYALRTPCMTKLAKVRDPEITRRYYVQEVLVTIVLLPLIPAVMAFFNAPLRRGFTTFWTAHPAAVVPVVLVGVFYGCHNIFGTMIYLDGRENTFCIPLFCGASFLAGYAAVFILSVLFAFPTPPASQFVSSAMIISALLLLSPFHHKLEDAWAFVSGKPLRAATVADGPQLILFVCSGNTCRSPMAAAISNALAGGRIRAESGGLAPRAGAPMTAESHTALAELAIDAPPHAARAVTREQVAAASAIYCMTESQRRLLIEQYPEAAAKASSLDPAGDIPDPIGHGLAMYAEVARRIEAMVRLRLDALQSSASAVPSL
jgi:protein-tyrosine-phosphatase